MYTNVSQIERPITAEITRPITAEITLRWLYLISTSRKSVKASMITMKITGSAREVGSSNAVIDTDEWDQVGRLHG